MSSNLTPFPYTWDNQYMFSWELGGFNCKINENSTDIFQGIQERIMLCIYFETNKTKQKTTTKVGKNDLKKCIFFSLDNHCYLQKKKLSTLDNADFFFPPDIYHLPKLQECFLERRNVLHRKHHIFILHNTNTQHAVDSSLWIWCCLNYSILVSCGCGKRQ